MDFFREILDIKKDIKTGGVVYAKFLISAKDGDILESFAGDMIFEPDPSSENFILFQNITEQDIFLWMSDEYDFHSIERDLKQIIESKKSSSVISEFPWK